MARATSKEPVVLAILDGWGNRAETDANAIANAKTPIFDRIAARGLRTMLAAGGEAVGLAPDQPGNVEAGHRAIGAGRIEPQFAVRVNAAFAGDGEEPIARNKELQDLILKTRSVGGAIHLIGLISPAGVEGHQYHLAVLAALMSHENVQVWIHAILDGEDADSKSGADCLGEFLSDIEGAVNPVREIAIQHSGDANGVLAAPDRWAPIDAAALYSRRRQQIHWHCRHQHPRLLRCTAVGGTSGDTMSSKKR